MTECIYCFNPAHDMALANNTSFYKAPDEIMRMAYDLAVLPGWYAGKGKVKINEWRQVELLRSQLGSGELFPEAEWTVQWESGRYMPWGWNPALLHTLRLAGVDEGFLLTDSQMKRIRELSGRQQCVAIQEAMREIQGVCGESCVCKSLRDVHCCMSEVGEVVLKAPWSGSGRGLVRVSSATWTESVEGWIGRILRTQGEIMAEPLYEKVCDFAMEFFADGAGNLFFIGYSLFDTDTHGNYKENRLLDDDRILQLLSSYVPVDLLLDVKIELMDRLSSMLKSDYRGYFGVDMMVCRQNGSYCVHPCVEINLRMNMGIVAHVVNRSLVHSRSEGYFRVEHYPVRGEALETHCSMKERHPLQLSDGRILNGYLSLTGVDADTRYQVYIIIAERE